LGSMAGAAAGLPDGGADWPKSAREKLNRQGNSSFAESCCNLIRTFSLRGGILVVIDPV
jgi:hypothetical protein